MPSIVATETFSILGVDAKCYALDDGGRVMDHQDTISILDVALARNLKNSELIKEMELALAWLQPRLQ